MTLDQLQDATGRCWQDNRMTSDRSNRALSSDVEVALVLAGRVGVRIAARFLANRGAGFALICRVLGEPERRRVDRPAVAQ
jgi:hypothetical protein